MHRILLPFLFIAMLSGCASYGPGGPPVAGEVVNSGAIDPGYPAYPGPGVNLGIGVGSWGRHSGGGVGIGVGF